MQYCIQILFLRKELKKNIINLLKRNKFTFFIGKSIIIIIFNYFIDVLRYLRFLFVKYGLISNKKFEQLNKFKDLHKGERCFIVATGPSLEYSDLNLIKEEISFSVNSIVKILDNTDWEPTYYGIQDINVFEKIEEEIINSNLKTIFVGDRLYDKYNLSTRFIPYFHHTFFHGKHGEMVPLTTSFSNDVSHIVYDGYSVTYSMFQLACYMGFSEIYLLGCDCNYDINGKQHFVESGFFDKQADSVGERMIYAFSKAKKFTEKNGVKVYNATKGGMLEIFERVKLEDLFKK